MRRTSVFDGLDVFVLQSRLTALQMALLDLQAGAKVVTASYAQGDGSRSVTYTAANMADLTQAILTVQTQIDRLTGVCINRRAPVRPLF
jgi:hypothetical protein